MYWSLIAEYSSWPEKSWALLASFLTSGIKDIQHDRLVVNVDLLSVRVFNSRIVLI